MHHWQSTYNTCNPFLLFQVNIVPGYPLRASSSSWIIFISAVSQIAYPNETHDNKNTGKCSSLIFSHRQNPGRMLMTQIPSATTEVLSQSHFTHIEYHFFFFLLTLHTADEDSSAENIFRGKHDLLSLNDLLWSFVCVLFHLYYVFWLYL